MLALNLIHTCVFNTNYYTSATHYLLVPSRPNVLVRGISGRIHARFFRWSGRLIQSSQNLANTNCSRILLFLTTQSVLPSKVLHQLLTRIYWVFLYFVQCWKLVTTRDSKHLFQYIHSSEVEHDWLATMMWPKQARNWSLFISFVKYQDSDNHVFETAHHTPINSMLWIH